MKPLCSNSGEHSEFRRHLNCILYTSGLVCTFAHKHPLDIEPFFIIFLLYTLLINRGFFLGCRAIWNWFILHSFILLSLMNLAYSKLSSDTCKVWRIMCNFQAFMEEHIQAVYLQDEYISWSHTLKYNGL